MRILQPLSCALTFGLCIGQTSLAAKATDVGVDVALVIAGDVSGSMDAGERSLQRDGFAAAFRHPDVIKAIASGLTGRIAVTYVQWAGLRVSTVREFVLDLGITINGLTFPAKRAPTHSAYISNAPAFDLAQYYADCVIGGAGGFAIAVDEAEQFATLIRRKVALEIASQPPPVSYANYATSVGGPANCTD